MTGKTNCYYSLRVYKFKRNIKQILFSSVIGIIGEKIQILIKQRVLLSLLCHLFEIVLVLKVFTHAAQSVP